MSESVLRQQSYVLPLPFFDPDFARLKAWVIEHTGLAYYADKDDALWDRLRPRFRALGCRSVGDYLDRIEARRSGEAQALIAAVTIGETFFFRFREQFAALRDTILPDCIERHRDDRRLRIWSAGSSTGAEPFSVAIVLRDLLGEAIEDWHITLLGTDISAPAVAAAEQGRFSPWALRALSPEEKQRHFTQDGNSWQLRLRDRALVRFKQHNLLDLLAPGAGLELSEFDLILCRNVLIYFDEAHVVATFRALAERLAPEGWLLLGHSDAHADFATLLTAVELPGTMAFRRLVTPPTTTPSRIVAIPPPPPTVESLMPAPHPVPLRAPILSAPPPVIVPADAPGLAAVAAFADRGDYAAAQSACGQMSAREPMNPALHYYAGLLHLVQGDVAAAEAALRRAIYLDKTFVLAHYQLGTLLIADGRVVAGRKSVSNAARLAVALNDDAILPESDGMSAAAFREQARFLLETVAGS